MATVILLKAVRKLLPVLSGNHSLKDCKSEAFSCINCENLKSRSDFSDVDTNHDVWDYEKCRYREQTIKKIKQDLFGFAL